MTIQHHINDLPAGVDFGASVAVDTETMGLNPYRDRLCLVQMSDAAGNCHLVQFPRGTDGQADYSAPNLKALMTDPKVVKLFHYARFDVAIMAKYLGIRVEPVYCTKIASKMVRTFTDKHGLKDLCLDLLGIELSKQQQQSDWGAADLTPEQMTYAAQDVLHLHAIQAELERRLIREGRQELAQACFRFLPDRATLDLLGWETQDIFSH